MDTGYRVNKKPSALVEDPIALATLHSVSKAALVDFAADMVRRIRQNEELDGEELARAFVEEFEPVAIARGDKPPKVAAPRGGK